MPLPVLSARRGGVLVSSTSFDLVLSLGLQYDLLLNKVQLLGCQYKLITVPGSVVLRRSMVHKSYHMWELLFMSGVSLNIPARSQNQHNE